MTFGLSDKTHKLIQSVLAEFAEIEKVYIYGSRAKGNYKPGSDIDISIVAPEMTYSDLVKLEIKLDDLFLPYKLDISLFHLITNPSLLEHIQRVGVIFYERNSVLD